MQVSGGLGLFLLGMIVMTDGLRNLAGDRMRVALMRFTKSPLSGAITGASATAILQSSSAMTVAAVGFVSAGLISFAEALGVIFGANIGTTITGWLVALLGLKFQLGSVMLPVILIGVLLRLLAKDKLAATGYALTGFALIFVGIGLLQEGMAGLQGSVTPEQFPDDSWAGRFMLLGIGMLITIVTQSSSAGVATALTALFVGAIDFHQAAALVIGMDVGTTATAALATIGGSIEARRTGLSHVIYNLMTGCVALLIITPYVSLLDIIAPGQVISNPEICLVAFHTSFNLLGVIIVLPFTRQFAALMQRIIVDSSVVKYVRYLPGELLQQPALALNAVQQAAQQQFVALLQHIEAILDPDKHSRLIDLNELQRALDNTHLYLDELHLSSEHTDIWNRAVMMFHLLDHLQRLHERCEEEEQRAITARETPQLKILGDALSVAIREIIVQINDHQYTVAAKQAERLADYIQQASVQLRADIIHDIPTAELSVSQGTEQLQAIRWLCRSSGHVRDISAYLARAVMEGGKVAP